jgi:2,5-diamino-6-(ribosylamino)-4(3H)-pyrimidinone 5'-phosphate reductase
MNLLWIILNYDRKMELMNRPHILVNVAMTADGKIDTFTRNGAVISSEADKARVDRLRASVDAVLVGGRTLLNEDPKLTVKSAELRAERLRKGLPENPAKVGVVSDIPLAEYFNTSSGGRRESGSGVKGSPLKQFLTSGPAKIYLFMTRCNEPEIIAQLENAGATLNVTGGDRVDLKVVFRSLYDSGIRSVLVEGGGTLIAELFRLDLVDELTIYIAPMIFGGASSPTPADGPGFLIEQTPHLKLKTVEKLNDQNGIFVHYIVEHKE